MSDLEFSFEQTPWEAFLLTKGTPSAAHTAASKFQRQRSVGAEAEGCLLHLGGHSSSSALGRSLGPTTGLSG